jgi:heavy metal sensor kinase
MKSIRLALVFYFLALLAVALGAVSVLVFRTEHQTLQAKQDATRQLLQVQYNQNCTKARARLDESLSYQANFLAWYTQYQQPARQRYRELNTPIGLLTAFATPNGPYLIAPWLAEGVTPSPGMPRGSLSERVSHEMWIRLGRGGFDINFPEDDELHKGIYIQVNTRGGGVYRSKSLREKSLTLPFDPAVFAHDQAPGEQVGDVEVARGQTVRRVLVKVGMPGFPRRTPGPGRGRPFPPRSGEPKPPQAMTLQPFMAIQCASDKIQLKKEIDRLTAEYQADRDHLESDTRASLVFLRNCLLAIALGTFAACALGGFALVRLGLAPVGRLSDAVSRVSPKDFRLLLDKRSLPVELTGIADRLTETLEMLKRAFAREKQAAADISHELRTPLASLLTTTEVALRKQRSAEEYREALADCRESGKQMSRLVERLLALARLDAGVDTLRAQSVDVAALAEQCAALVRPLAEARSLSLCVKSEGPTRVVADADKLREVLTNLLHNAVQYNRPQGSIEVAVARDNGHLRMEVRDTGIGIAPEARAHIFERFYRADPARRADGLHAGLGLAIVKGYVDLMGGNIAVDSTEGQGSTFRIDLPTAPAGKGPGT